MPPSRFQALVAEGLEQGMSKMAAERRARDILYGDPPDEDPPPPSAPAEPPASASVEELWQKM
jgi:hypothetical protein